MILLLYIITLAIIATSCFILGLYILTRDRDSVINRLFFLNSILLNIVVLFTMLIQLTDSSVMATGFQSIYNIFLILFLLESLCFNLIFARAKLHLLLRFLIAVWSATVFIIFTTHGQALLLLTKENGMWVYEFINYGFWFYTYSPLLLLIIVLMIWVLYRFQKYAPLNREKRQARVMMIFILVACGGGFCFLMIFPAIGIYRSPLLTPYFFAVYLYGVFFAMTKYKFMSFGIRDMTREIMSSIMEGVFVLGTDWNIRELNEQACRMLHREMDDLRGTTFTDIVLGDAEFFTRIDDLVNGGADSFRWTITYPGEPENIVTDSRITRICDRFDDFAGVLVVSRENMSIPRFRRVFALTVREMEVILLTISGAANSEIAEKLGIVKRTVETHQKNIYNKLGIGNKIELVKLASGYGIRQL